MGIAFNKEKRQFHLQTNNTSYLMEVVEGGHLLHCYWGEKIHTPDLSGWVDFFEAPSFSPNPQEGHLDFSFETVPREYPDYGRSDYQSSAFNVVFENGTSIVEPVYKTHRIVKGKPILQGLPSTYVITEKDAESLIITLRDEVSGLEIDLNYTVFETYDAITRSAVIRNTGIESIRLEKVLSANIDFFEDHDFELINLYGNWARERHLSRIPVGRSSHVVDSRRGASSHSQNPFIALVRPTTTEDNGDVYSMNLVYSGSFYGEVSVNGYGKTRMQIGLGVDDFTWDLKEGESFVSPEAVMVYTSKGLNRMSAIYHCLYRERLCRGTWQYKERPILINNWEATYFEFDESIIDSIMTEGAALGMELFVLDDGWFGDRDTDTSGLGDWFVNKKKLPGGLKGLSDRASELGILFGLWFEPEMISPNSLLYSAHPDWCLHVPDRHRSTARHQLILDMSREDVQQYIIETISEVLNSADIRYVKWDMNRNMSEAGSALLEARRQGETTHRYMLGLYRVLEVITARFPEILFESCSGGGGRFDPGMLHYMPQTWTSDDTDSFERLKIQWGTSMLYPPITMGAHISEVPNHQVGRLTPLSTRANVAMAANFGFELNVTKMSEEEKGAVTDYINIYKGIRKTIQFGDFYRLISPYENNGTSWMFKSKDGNQVVVYYYRHLAVPNHREGKLKLKYLDRDAKYRLEDGSEFYGDTLMHFGLRLPEMKGDFASVRIVMERIE